MEKKTKFFGSRAFRKGSMSLVFTIVVIVLVVLLNIVASALSDRFPLSLDLTVGGDYTMELEDEHLEFLKGVDKNVNIIVCANENDFDNGNFASNMINTLSLTDMLYGAVSDTTSKYARQTGVFIEDFTKLNPKFSVSYRDPNSATSFSYVTGKYPSETFTYGDIIVECVHADGNERYQKLSMSDYFSYEMNTTIYYSYYQEAYDLIGSALATNLTSAVYVTSSEDSVKLSVYTENGCTLSNDLRLLLERNNYEIEEITSFAYASEDSKAVIVYAPTKDFNKNTVDSLDRYLKNNGNHGRNLIFVANTSSMQQYNMPVLTEYLAEWGITMSAGWVCEPDERYSVQGLPYYVTAISSDSDYSEGIDEEKLSYPYSLYVGFKLAFEENDYYATESILQSSDDAVLLPFNAASDWAVETAEKTGPYNYIVKSSLANTKAVDSNVIAIAGDTFFDFELMESGVYQSDYLNSLSFANAQLTLNIFNDLTGAKQQNSIDITTKTITTSSFYDKLTDSPWPNIVFWVFVITIPVACIVAGIVIYLVRKRK